MKDGRTHVAHTTEHAVDLEAGAVARGEPDGDTWGDLPLALRGGGRGLEDRELGPGPETGLLWCGSGKALDAGSRGLTAADATLYANSTPALDIDDGRIAWYYQHVPAESLDMDEAFERVLVDIDGRPVVLSVGKHGILWKLDRTDGRHVSRISQIDPCVIA